MQRNTQGYTVQNSELRLHINFIPLPVAHINQRVSKCLDLMHVWTNCHISQINNSTKFVYFFCFFNQTGRVGQERSYALNIFTRYL